MRGKLWLLGLATILVAIVTVLLLGMLQESTTATPMPAAPLPKPGGEMTARQAYQALQSWLETWSDDAQLVSVAATYLKPEGQGQGWSFQVYSPSRRKLAVVFVAPDRVWVVREQQALYAQTAISLDEWTLDSNEFLSQWWQQQGHLSWKNSRAHSMHLRLNPVDGELLWMVTVLSEDVQLVEAWQMNATTGEVVNSEVGGEQ